MVIEAFPPHDSADENGLLAIGGDLDVESLLLAYENGIFPWPIFEEDILAWFSPPQRALLFVDEVRVPRSLQKQLRRSRFEIRVNTEFHRVVGECAKLINRGRQKGTWINRDIINAYTELHAKGYAHSIECWERGELVGGLYGVSLGAMFAGESMFFRTSNASKFCLLFLIDYLRTNNVPWLDCQQQTPLLTQFGSREVPRKEFLRLLAIQLQKDVSLFRE